MKHATGLGFSFFNCSKSAFITRRSAVQVCSSLQQMKALILHQCFFVLTSFVLFNHSLTQLLLMGLTPQTMGLPPQTLGLTPRTLGMTPRTLGLTPRTLGLTPRTLGLTPRTLGLTPRTLGLPPRYGGSTTNIGGSTTKIGVNTAKGIRVNLIKSHHG